MPEKRKTHKSILEGPAKVVPQASETFDNRGRRSHISLKARKVGKGPDRHQNLDIRKNYKTLE